MSLDEEKREWIDSDLLKRIYKFETGLTSDTSYAVRVKARNHRLPHIWSRYSSIARYTTPKQQLMAPIDSSILSQKQKLDLLCILKSPKSVRLIYRASRDGFKSTDFHAKCDAVTPTCVVVRSEHNHVFGGVYCLFCSRLVLVRCVVQDIPHKCGMTVPTSVTMQRWSICWRGRMGYWENMGSQACLYHLRLKIVKSEEQ